MILIFQIKKGWNCIIPKKILSGGKTYNFKEEFRTARHFGTDYLDCGKRHPTMRKPTAACLCEGKASHQEGHLRKGFSSDYPLLNNVSCGHRSPRGAAFTEEQS
jgi:hypothetical protein